MKLPLPRKPFLFPPQIKLSAPKPQIPVLKEKGLVSVKKIASEYLQMKRDGKIPDGYARSLMIEALPEKCMIVHKSMLADYRKANLKDQDLILTNKYVQKLLLALSKKSTSTSYKKIQVEEIWSDISGTRLNFTLDTYLAFLDCFVLVRDKVMMEKMHDMLVRAQGKHPWTRNIYAGLIRAHHSFANKYAIKRLFEAYEKQFAPINKNGFLAPFDDELNVKLKIMVAEYFNALIVANNHDYFTIVLDKLSRMSADNIFSRLNEEAYKAIFESLTITGNAEMAKRYFKILKYHHKKTPLEYKIFYNALECISKISSFRESKIAYRLLNEIRAKSITESNAKADVNYTIAEMTRIFMDFIKTSQPQPQLEKFRFWNSPLPPINVQTMISSSIGKSLDIDLIRSFFKSEILTEEYLMFYWSRQVSTNTKKLDDLFVATQAKLDKVKNAATALEKKKKSKSTTTKSPVNELKLTLTWIGKRKKRGLTLLYGQNGPLSHLYTALVNGWQESLKSVGNENGLDPLKFDSLLQELEDMEKEVVLKSEIGKYLLVRTVAADDDEVPGDEQSTVL
jgi:hypothetical protein